MIDRTTSTIKDIVLDDFRTAAVFEKYSLDFCCRGGITIDQACKERGVRAESVNAELDALPPKDPSRNVQPIPDEAMSPDSLIDLIVRIHHSYVRSAIPVIYAHTQKVAKVHGANHPEVVEIARHFAAVAEEMTQHMQKEELMLFPYIKHILSASRTGTTISAPPFGSAQNPIRMMEAEHAAAGDAMYSIRSLSSGYTPPDDACTTYRVAYQELQEFELDLHRHVHLENNILFPRALAG